MKKVSRKQIDEVVSLVKEVQKLTGRKVKFKEATTKAGAFMDGQGQDSGKIKEANGEAEGNRIVKRLQNVISYLEAMEISIERLNEKSVFRMQKVLTSRVAEVKKIVTTLIQEETQHSDDTLPIEEDVDMDIEQITSEPQVVDKLNQKDININLVDKNKRDSAGTSSMSSSSSY